MSDCRNRLKQLLLPLDLQCKPQRRHGIGVAVVVNGLVQDLPTQPLLVVIVDEVVSFLHEPE